LAALVKRDADLKTEREKLEAESRCGTGFGHSGMR
jgi:hypothetical protein